jgi:hypothetical protein
MLNKAGFAVGQGEKVNLKAESAASIAYRRDYLRKAIKNRQGGLTSVEEDLKLMRDFKFHGGLKKQRIRRRGQGPGFLSKQALFNQRGGWTRGTGFDRPVLSGDEMAINVNHVVQRTRFDKKRKEINRIDGKGKRLCVWGLFGVFNEPNSDTVQGKVVHYRYFEAQKKSGAKQVAGPTVKTVQEQIRAVSAAAPLSGKKVEVMQRFLDLVAAAPNPGLLSAETLRIATACTCAIASFEAEMAPGGETPDDYHGNFDKDKFSVIFEEACKAAREDPQIGEADIHIDGATYHKLCTNPSPSASTKREQMIAWIRARQVELNSAIVTEEQMLDSKAGGLTNAELFERLKPHRPEKHFEVFDIASKYGHKVYFTPPYEHGLAFCEPCWGNIKNPIAAASAKDMPDLKVKVKHGLDNLSGSSIVGAYAKTRQYQDELWDREDDVSEDAPDPQTESDDDMDESDEEEEESGDESDQD